MLKAIWDFFFYSCKHKWNIIKVITIVDDHSIRIGTKYHLQCTKCGNVKNKKV